MKREIESLIALDQELVSYLEIKENEIIKEKEGVKNKIEKLWAEVEDELKALRERTSEEYDKKTHDEVITLKTETRNKVEESNKKYQAIKEALIKDTMDYIINSSKGE
ncbi:hypothetical protein GCM10008905_07600 [Clostridium malenominatum]|uniref:Uncharacterized protein n=1 Tax=Clostridium malenominatum TaxID=1539 RepID=A0ABP3U008_9CLOT